MTFLFLLSLATPKTKYKMLKSAKTVFVFLFFFPVLNENAAV